MVNIDLTHDYPKQTTSQSVIRFQDCDPMRHLNNAKYFDYFFHLIIRPLNSNDSTIYVHIIVNDNKQCILTEYHI